MSIVRWNPSRELDELFSRFVDQGFNGWGENIATSDWNPSVDIRETDEDYQIDLEVPAVPASDVKVTFSPAAAVAAAALSVSLSLMFMPPPPALSSCGFVTVTVIEARSAESTSVIVASAAIWTDVVLRCV